jgi:hypothetical protein
MSEDHEWPRTSYLFNTYECNHAPRKDIIAIGHGVLLSCWLLESVKLTGFSLFGGLDDAKVLISTDIMFSLTVAHRYHYIEEIIISLNLFNNVLLCSVTEL